MECTWSVQVRTEHVTDTVRNKCRSMCSGRLVGCVIKQSGMSLYPLGLVVTPTVKIALAHIRFG